MLVVTSMLVVILMKDFIPLQEMFYGVYVLGVHLW
jgi:hypothetical protein